MDNSEVVLASLEANVLIKSMCTLLTTKMKSCFLHPKKNKELARDQDLHNLIVIIGE